MIKIKISLKNCYLFQKSPNFAGNPLREKRARCVVQVTKLPAIAFVSSPSNGLALRGCQRKEPYANAFGPFRVFTAR